MTDDHHDWVEQIVWGTCPAWCTCSPDTNPGLGNDGHITDLRQDGTAVRYHNCRWPLPDSDDPDAVQAIELEIIETRSKAGRPAFGEPRFLVDSDRGQYLSVASAVAASGIIRQALADMAGVAGFKGHLAVYLHGVRADSPPLCATASSFGARRFRLARSLGTLSSIALSRLPSRRQRA